MYSCYQGQCIARGSRELELQVSYIVRMPRDHIAGLEDIERLGRSNLQDQP